MMVRTEICILLLLAAATSAVGGEEPPPPEPCVESVTQTIFEGGTSGAQGVYSADVDGDGLVDVLSASANDNTIAWFRNEGGDEPVFSSRIVISDRADGAAAVFAADLDGDDDTDVLSASANDNKISWYQNNGLDPPSFVERVLTTGANGAASVYAADIDGDEDMDVLSASVNDDTIAWYENDGADPPAFTEHVITSSADGASSVFAADIDGDMILDVLSASRFDDTVAWYETEITTENPDTEDETTTVTFTAHDISTNDRRAISVYAADLDNDHDIDVLSAANLDGEIAWYETEFIDEIVGERPNQETVRTVVFHKHFLDSNAPAATSVFAADVNKDGLDDVLSSLRGDNEVPASIRLYVNNPTSPGSFGEGDTVSDDVPGANGVVAAQLDDNLTHLEIVSVSSVPGVLARKDKIAWYLSDELDPPSFTEHPISGSSISPEALSTGLINPDDHEDLVVASLADNKIAWYENDGMSDPTFTEHIISLDFEEAADVFLADLDKDGNADALAASRGDNKVAWFRNELADPPPPGNGTTDGFGDEMVISSNVDGAVSVFAEDLNGDEFVDALAGAAGSGHIYWYENDGAMMPTFGNAIIITDEAPGVRSLFAKDLDNDGDVDVLSASVEDDTIAWYESDLADQQPPGRTMPSFQRHVISDTAFGAWSVFAEDINGDGFPDVLSASRDDDTIAWYDLTEMVDDEPVEHVITFTAQGASSVSAADIDGDDDMDVIATSTLDDTVAWYEADITIVNEDQPDEVRTVTFTEHVISTFAASVRDGAAADVDGDGNLDVVSAFLFQVAWNAGGATEACTGFDADGDDRIDGLELVWMATAFGRACVNPMDPDEWWLGVDFNQDCRIDGDDLAILTAQGVWGKTTTTCAFTCN